MEYKVNDFFNEINEIAPPPPNAVQEEVWKQCFDELTGYPYYWNKNTDEVTWNQPKSFEKNWKTAPKTAPKKNLFIPNQKGKLPSMPPSKNLPKDLLKIYSLGESTKQIPKKPESTLTDSDKKQAKRKYPKEDDSDDEKIVLISSYGTDSESEEEPPDTKKSKQEQTSVEPDRYNSEEDDDLDILAKIQKRAQELKELGGDVPVEVKEVVETSKRELTNVPKNGPSLVASYYSDSDDENDEIKKIFPNKPEPVAQVSHSTLFPITKPISVKDFSPPRREISATTPAANQIDTFDAKLFKRKKKIAVPFVGPVKKDNPDGETRKGLGYEKEIKPADKTSDNMYLGFRKGGVEFVKSDVLEPTVNNIEENKPQDDKEAPVDKEEIDNMYSTLKDKLLFLNEGRPALSSVQSMVVQAETLMTALNDGALKGSYIKKWLADTCSEMKILEKDAAPTGWALQWDRIHRRYFYHNRQTGTNQWEYPQPDRNTNHVAMDISTTPPPVIETELEEMSPPLPPAIRSPSPPPPPIISVNQAAEIPLPSYDVPLPADIIPFVPQKVELNGQPLPPGVDLPDVTTAQQQTMQPLQQQTMQPLQQQTMQPPQQQTTQPPPPAKDSLNSALDSFYSDIAAISSPLTQQPPVEETAQVNVAVAPALAEIPSESAKKKKKVKLISNLGMKKKGVSQLVEKWRNVQQEYKN